MIYRFRRSDVHQEEDVLPWGKVLAVFLATLTIALVLVGWAWQLLTSREAALRPSRQFPERHIRPDPGALTIEQDLYGEVGPGQLLHERQRRQLSTYGWVDRDRRVVSIPIDQAMDLVVEESRR
jgi:hypothetical protein